MSISDAARVERPSKLPWQVAVAVALLWTALLWPALGFLVSRRREHQIEGMTGTLLPDGHVVPEGQPIPYGQLVIVGNMLNNWLIPLGLVSLICAAAVVGAFLVTSVLGTLVLAHRAGWRAARRWGLWLSVPYTALLLWIINGLRQDRAVMTLYGRWYLPFLLLLILGYASWLLGAAYLLADPAVRAWHQIPSYDTPPLVAVGTTRRPKRPVRRLPPTGRGPART